MRMQTIKNFTKVSIPGRKFNTLLMLGAALLAVWIPATFRPGPVPAGKAGAPALDHAQWDALVKKHVTADGWVSYAGFRKDSVKLNAYLKQLSDNPPAANAPRNEAMAYWINAYNAFTVKLILTKYPVKSIKDLNPAIAVYKVNTVWQWKFFSIGGQPMNLDQIEHEILRKKYPDGRIHFALNCASVSCPVLRAEAYTAANLEKQLDDQARRFLKDPLRNKITADKAQLSLIFSWFKGDFEKNGTRRDFLNKYSAVPLPPEAEWKYLEYDWNLNDAK